MRLNPPKCSLGLAFGKFFGYLMMRQRIEFNPEQLREIQEMPLPKNKKEIQRLIGRLTTLGCFISRYSNKFQPFFKTLKAAQN